MTGPRSLHIVSSLRLSAGGPTQSVTRLCESLNALGAPAEIATVADPEEAPIHPPHVPVHAFPLHAPLRLRRSPELAAFLRQEAHRFDLIHVHGLWEWPGRYARRAALSAGKPLVLSPRGMLEPWSLRQNAWVKRLALALWERRNLEGAALLHATADTEAEQFRAMGLHTPIAVVPNGLDFPDPRRVEGANPPIALFLSRFHPKKGADLLLRAWATLAPSDWQLVLAGPDPDGLQAQLEVLARNLGLGGRVAFLGAHYDDAKWDLFRRSSLFVLPSHSENFGNVVAEALSQGLPVIATQGTPWKDLEPRGCGWWVPPTAEGLATALKAALALPQTALADMGRKGQAWARSAFSAEAAAREMLRHYEDLSAHGPHRP
ncbi:MAG: glycosyltransferase [Geothrix sp.]|nr:glycosyltransferase [Geothrix sp.]